MALSKTYTPSNINELAIWVVVFSIVTSLLFIAAFFVTSFFQKNTKVNTIKVVTKFLMVDLVALGITFFGSVIVSIIYLSSSGAYVICLEIGFQIIQYALLGLFLFKFVRIADDCQVHIIAYHDFLISYRQTPRSKILKKHLP